MSCLYLFLVNKMSKAVVLCLFTLWSCGRGEHGKVFDLPEGSPCAWDGQQGRCININNCQQAKHAIQQKMHPPICSFQATTPIVCCTTCLPSQTTVVRRLDPFRDFAADPKYNKSSKARDNCFTFLKNLKYPCSFPAVRLNLAGDRVPFEECVGFIDKSPFGASGHQTSRRKRGLGNEFLDNHHFASNVPQVSHGVEARRRQYPHMALLGYGDDIQSAQWLCGGSVISEKFILTAAHCISSPTIGPVKFTALGILKRSDKPEYWQIHNVKRIIAHPEYKPPSKYNDIALLETEKTISFNVEVLPACLPLVPEADETAEATGWGALGHRKGLADTLQTVRLQRYDASNCSLLYPKHRHLREGYNHSSQMCYGDVANPKDTCEGDSGGPLQTRNAFLSCAHTVLGVTSYGRQCGVSAGSGMYTRVYHYVPWIESVVWP